MARLWSDLLRSSGNRYWFALDSAPGIVVPGVGSITLNGNAPAVSDQSQVFRTPATAALTLFGQSLSSPTLLTPATAALSSVGQIPAEQRIKVVSPALPAPDYGTPADNPPTLQTIMLVQPGKADLQIQVLAQNVTQGGNIGFIAPGVASLTLNGYQVTLPREPGLGFLQVIGLTPTLDANALAIVEPITGYLTTTDLAPDVSVPFVWTDDTRQSGTTWIDDPRA